jgi:hypothetical protein
MMQRAESSTAAACCCAGEARGARSGPLPARRARPQPAALRERGRAARAAADASAAARESRLYSTLTRLAMPCAASSPATPSHHHPTPCARRPSSCASPPLAVRRSTAAAVSGLHRHAHSSRRCGCRSALQAADRNGLAMPHAARHGTACSTSLARPPLCTGAAARPLRARRARGQGRPLLSPLEAPSARRIPPPLAVCHRFACTCSPRMPVREPTSHAALYRAPPPVADQHA